MQSATLGPIPESFNKKVFASTYDWLRKECKSSSGEVNAAEFEEEVLLDLDDFDLGVWFEIEIEAEVEEAEEEFIEAKILSSLHDVLSTISKIFSS